MDKNINDAEINKLQNQPKDIQASWSNKDEPAQGDNLIVEGYIGTWYVIDAKNINGTDYSLLEHEDYGDEAACLIVDAKGELILDDVHNGFLDLEEYLDSQPTVTQAESLPEGWQWHDYNDGSGHLQSPQGESYFSYDLSTNEVKPFEDMAWQKYEGTLKELKASAERWVIDYGLNKSVEDARNEFRNGLSPKGKAEWDEWLKLQAEEKGYYDIHLGREAELYEYHKDETNDEDTQKWRDHLTDAEQAVVNKWDSGFEKSISVLAEKIANHTAINSHSEANARSRLFVDMDGTLAVFTPVDTLEILYEKGYFANLEPQQKVVDAIKLVIAENPNVEVNILSAYLTDSKTALDEKNQWLDTHLPEIDIAHRVFIPCGEDKKLFIDNLKQTDFLLDDYTKNLTLWQPPATGIKLLNGINHTHGTWQGNMIRHDNSAAEIAKNIRAVVNGEQVIEKPQITIKTEVPLPKGYIKIHENNDIIMASEQCADGSTQYAIWHIEDARNGVWGGTYIRDDAKAAHKCFAIKSGMVDENTVFNDDELTEIYKCLKDTTCGKYKLSPTDKNKIVNIGCKIELAIPDIHERIYVEINQESTKQPQPVPTEDLEFEL